MKQWIKLERKLLEDNAINSIINDFGLKGFGAFIIMKIYVECSETISVAMLWKQCKGIMRKSQFVEILHDYGFFSIDDGLVSIAHTHVDTPAQSQVQSRVQSQVQSQVSVPFTEREKEKNISSSLKEMVEMLKKEDGQWKEVVCMRSGYCALLSRFWNEAIDEWHLHVISYDRTVSSYSEARSYFNAFVKLTTPSGTNLRDHLHGLDSLKQQEQADDRWM